MTQEGLILKGVGGYYTVLYQQDKLCTLKARGRFRVLDQIPLPGDRVMFEVPPENIDGAMGQLLPRKNALVRPRVANVDRLLIIACPSYPDPDWNLVDVLCANALMNGIQPVCILNKSDLASEEQKNLFLSEYAVFEPICVSSKTGEGMDELFKKTAGFLCCFAGQSGVGKSSLINVLIGKKSFDTGGLSKKTSRGKHTTRHAELIPCSNGATMVDTPGFSLMELPLIKPEKFGQLYPEFVSYEASCRFAGCLHNAEPDCAVKAAAEDKQIPMGRLKRYQQLLTEVQHKWRNRYE